LGRGADRFIRATNATLWIVLGVMAVWSIMVALLILAT
jgi:hypothetical protein